MRKSDTDCVTAIHQLLDGTEWTAGTIEHVAMLIADTGRSVRGVGEEVPDDMATMIDTLHGMAKQIPGDLVIKSRIIDQIAYVRTMWQAMCVDHDDVPQVPLTDSPGDGPGCKRDARGRMYYSAKWTT